MFLRGQKSLTQRRAQYYNVVDTNTDGGRGAVIRQVWFLEGFTMSIQNEYLSGLMERVVRRNPAEPEFHQAVQEVAPVAHNDLHTQRILEFNRTVADDPRVENVIVPLRDGLNLIRVK